MKNHISHCNFLRVLMCALAVVAFTIFPAPKLVAGDFTYVTNNSSITITGYNGSGGTVSIPASLDGFPVTGIQANVFAYNAAITNVVIPAGVTNIADGAFLDCPNLTRATVPGNVSHDFDGTGTFFFSVVFGQSPVTSLTIADGSPFIKQWAFAYSTNVTSVTIPNSVTHIERQAFFLSGLTHVTIPDSVTDLGSATFNFCTNLTSATLGSGATSLEGTFRNCQRLGSITIPISVTNIGNSVFQDCYGLTNVVIPSSVIRIGQGAFSGCTNLPQINLPESVTTIGPTAFARCSRLKDIVIPAGVSSIESSTFASCFGLINITLPNVVTNIGQSAFTLCTSLPRLVLPSGAPRIDASTFSYCGSLTNLVIPAGVTNIALTAFQDCTNLITILLPDSVTGIADGAFARCFSLSHVMIPSAVTSIGTAAFQSCHSLLSITVPNGVINLGANAFADCVSLTNVTVSGNFPYSITAAFDPPFLPGLTFAGDFIKENALYQVTNLTSVTISGSVTNIGDSAFLGCSGLTNLTLNHGLQTIGKLSFTSCTSLRDFTIPNSVRVIDQAAFYQCQGLTRVEIPDSVTEVGFNAFHNCANLTSATVGRGLTTLGRVFQNCFNLSSVTLPNTLTNISGTFSACRSLTNVVIPNSVTTIGNTAFSGCWSLNGISIPKSVTTIGTAAFRFCSSLTQIHFAGNAPTPDNDLSVFEFTPSTVTAYYVPGTTGWQPTFDGVRTKLWNPQAATLSTGGGQFGFNLTGPNNTVIVVEACTNLSSPVWVSVATNFLANGLSPFSDPNWGSYPKRFYRFTPSSVTSLPGTVFNPDFRFPPLPAGVFFRLNPTNEPGQPWTFAGRSGVANDLGDPNASYAVTDNCAGQYAFIQLANGFPTGEISQSVEFNQAGSYSLSFKAAGRSPANGNLNYRVEILPSGGSAVLNTTNSVANAAPFTSQVHPFTIASPGPYTIKFTAVSGFGASSDNTAFITDVVIALP